ncbi:MAG: hypothetical protein J6K14_05695 [Clostridia bacterium]|nr:hypothetical protein [Clostridia bacterium]
MNQENYSAELAIKKWANIIHICAYLIIGLFTFAGFIMLCIDADDFWWMFFAFSAGGLILSLPAFVTSHCMNGLAEIVGNTKKMANGYGVATNNQSDDILPEL